MERTCYLSLFVSTSSCYLTNKSNSKYSKLESIFLPRSLRFLCFCPCSVLLCPHWRIILNFFLWDTTHILCVNPKNLPDNFSQRKTSTSSLLCFCFFILCPNGTPQILPERDSRLTPTPCSLSSLLYSAVHLTISTSSMPLNRLHPLHLPCDHSSTPFYFPP